MVNLKTHRHAAAVCSAVFTHLHAVGTAQELTITLTADGQRCYTFPMEAAKSYSLGRETVYCKYIMCCQLFRKNERGVLF